MFCIILLVKSKNICFCKFLVFVGALLLASNVRISNFLNVS